jgi:hypothetical protein
MREVFFVFALSVSVEAAAQLSVLRVPSDAEDERPTGLSLVSATTDIRCREWGAEIRCTLEARYVIQNMAREAENAWLFFRAPGDASDVKIYVGSALRLLPDVSEKYFDERLFPGGEARFVFKVAQSQGVSLVQVLAEQRTTITVRCSLTPYTKFDYDTNNSALEERHRALAPEWRDEFNFSISPEKAQYWSVVGDSSLRVEAPARWEVFYDPSAPRYQREEGKRQLLSYQGLTPTDNFELTFRADQPRFQGGGMVFGVGASFIKDPFVFRMGYEAGSAKAVGVLASVSLETNFHSRAAVIPQLGLGVSAAVERDLKRRAGLLKEPLNEFQRRKIPMLGFFMGVPLLIEDTTGFQVGVRTQVDATWGPVGFSVPLDAYPANEQPFRLSLLGHFSF